MCHCASGWTLVKTCQVKRWTTATARTMPRAHTSSPRTSGRNLLAHCAEDETQGEVTCPWSGHGLWAVPSLSGDKTLGEIHALSSLRDLFLSKQLGEQQGCESCPHGRTENTALLQGDTKDMDQASRWSPRSTLPTSTQQKSVQEKRYFGRFCFLRQSLTDQACWPGTLYMDQAGLEQIKICLLLSPDCWD